MKKQKNLEEPIKRDSILKYLLVSVKPIPPPFVHSGSKVLIDSNGVHRFIHYPFEGGWFFEFEIDFRG
jgi:hypothetical protein